jgi:hypothetical protein
MRKGGAYRVKKKRKLNASSFLIDTHAGLISFQNPPFGEVSGLRCAKPCLPEAGF